MTIDEIKTAFGLYYLKNAANMARLVQQLYAKSTTDLLLTPFITDDTIWRASESRFTRVLQPFQKAWTPIAQVEFKPVEIRMFKQKIDTQEYPDDLEGTWLGFLAGDDIDRKQWPFIRWFVEKHLLPQAKQDYELNEVYKGVYAAPTAGTAGAAGTAMDGLKKCINDAIDADRITPISLGAIPSDNVDLVDYFEQFADNIDKRYWDIPMQVAVNQDIERRYKRGFRTKYGKDNDFKGTNAFISETALEIVGLPSMTGSSKIWCTPKDNVMKLGKKTQNMNNVQIDSVDRLIKIFSDWWSGVGFVIPELVWTNDLELPS